MRNRKFLFLAIFFIGVTLWGCFRTDQDDYYLIEPPAVELLPHDFPCDTIPNGSQGFDEYPTPLYHFRSPCFSPNNNSEICFIKINNNTLVYELWTINLSTGLQKKICENIWYNPVWGKSDWIVFNRTDNQIWKVKYDGGGLSQLTSGSFHLEPDWLPTGDRIICRSLAESSLGDLSIIDDTGFLDYQFSTQFRGLARPKWSPNNEMVAYYDGIGVGYIRLSDSVKINLAIPQGPSVYPFSWTPDSHFLYWADNSGLYRSEISNGITVLIKQNCESKIYVTPSISPDGTRLVVDRIDRQRISDHEIYSESFLYLMNWDGTGEVRIGIQ
jgi:Tol biopolymer transport system component